MPSLLGALATVSASGLGALALRFLSIALLSRLVEPAVFAGFFIGQSMALIISVVGNMSAAYAILEAPTLDHRAFWRAVLQPVVMCLLMIAAGTLLWQVTGAGDFLPLGPAGLAVVLSAPLLTALRSVEALGRRHLQFTHLSSAEIWATLSGFFICAPAFAVSGLAVWALPVGHWVHSAGKLAFVLGAARRGLPSSLRRADQDGGSRARERRASYGLELVDLASVHLVRLIVGALFDPVVVAFWARASQILLLAVNTIVHPVAYVVVPLGLSDGHRQRALITHGHRMVDTVLLLLVPVAASVVLVSPEVTRLILGAEWDGAAIFVQAFAFLLVARTGQRLFGILGRATRGNVRRLAIDAAGLTVFLSSFMLTAGEGAEVAAATFALTTTATTFAQFWPSHLDRALCIPWRFAAGALGFVAFLVAFSLAGGQDMPLLLRTLWLAGLWLGFAGLIVVGTLAKQPLLPLAMLMELAQRLETRAGR